MSSSRRVTEAGGARSVVTRVLGVTSVVTSVARSVSRRRGSVAGTAGGRSSVLLLELLLLVLLGTRNHRSDLVGGRGVTSAGRGSLVRAYCKASCKAISMMANEDTRRPKQPPTHRTRLRWSSPGFRRSQSRSCVRERRSPCWWWWSIRLHRCGERQWFRTGCRGPSSPCSAPFREPSRRPCPPSKGDRCRS